MGAGKLGTLLRALGWLALGAGVSSRAEALRLSLFDAPVQVDLSEDANVDYHFSHGNGNILPATNPNYDPTSDNYLDWFNRFEAQLNSGPWHVDLRFDSALFANTPQVSDITTPEGRRFAQLLENRYVSNFELEKVSASYTSRNLEATVGDFHLSYGRGLVISLLKIDALGVDTTLRGASVTGHLAGFSINVAGGVTNLVNTDPSLGAVAPDPGDPIAAAHLEYRWPRVFTLGLNGAIFWQNQGTLQLNSWTPGSKTQSVNISPLGVGTVETAPPSMFSPESVRTENFSAQAELTDLFGHGNLYAELAHQVQTSASGPISQQTEGNALYAGLNLFEGPFTLQAELKDYLFYNQPVFSSLPSNMFVAFWQQDVYNNPPNLEEIWQEENLTQHIFGPRLRLDYQASENVKPYVTGSYFVDNENGYDIYNAGAGVEADFPEHRQHLSASAGYRREVFNATQSDPGLIHATELWLRFDLLRSLTADYAVEFEGLLREHRDYAGAPVYHEWNQSYAYLSLRHTRFSASLGYELYTYATGEYQPNNVNVSGSYHVDDHWLVRAFVGSREAGLRCINGVCRNFPGFNGATVEIIAKY